MELRDYLQIIFRSLGILIATTLIAGILGYLWAKSQPVRYEASATIVVDKPSLAAAQGAGDYRYDKYYAQEASAMYADTLTSWLASPGTVREIHEKAGLKTPDVSLAKLRKIFRASREPSTGVVIASTREDADSAQRLVSTAVTLLDERTAAQRSDDDPDQYFVLEKDEIITTKVEQEPLLNALVAAIGGLILGLIFVFLRAYMKQK